MARRTISADPSNNVYTNYLDQVLQISPSSSLDFASISMRTSYGSQPRSNISYIILDQVCSCPHLNMCRGAASWLHCRDCCGDCCLHLLHACCMAETTLRAWLLRSPLKAVAFVTLVSTHAPTSNAADGACAGRCGSFRRPILCTLCV